MHNRFTSFFFPWTSRDLFLDGINGIGSSSEDSFVSYGSDDDESLEDVNVLDIQEIQDAGEEEQGDLVLSEDPLVTVCQQK